MSLTVNNNNRFQTPAQQLKERRAKIFLRIGNRAQGYGFTSSKTTDVSCKLVSMFLRGQGAPPPKKIVRDINIISNLLKIGCYLPIIGQIIGIAGLILLGKLEKEMISKAKDSKGNVADQIKMIHNFTSHVKARFILSTIGLGIVYLPLDIVFSGIHHHDWQQIKKLDNKINEPISAGRFH